MFSFFLPGCGLKRYIPKGRVYWINCIVYTYVEKPHRTYQNKHFFWEMDGYQVSSCAVTKNNINSVIAKITTKTTDQAESCFKLYFRFSQMDGIRDA